MNQMSFLPAKTTFFAKDPVNPFKALVQGASTAGGGFEFPPALYQKIAGETLRLIFFEIEKKLFSKDFFCLRIRIGDTNRFRGSLSNTFFLTKLNFKLLECP